ncbi:hypothetical protein GCM10011613_28780 [Cellvibrio zantedeschiae]|uniref:Acyltransferase n=1 Tax=Cellvibrio zantedeschiae TaxID=1237077 RepID=A0ABQ3BAY4_9GAMM|nr:acyltransferase [Cellvibrio zantedeschiae]GGY82266.1 hypothetical protein GCM10011613_28780 [Cellvibrio zantedeschiae]
MRFMRTFFKSIDFLLSLRFHIIFGLSGNIKTGKKLTIKGHPIIHIEPGCHLIIGTHVVLNSSNMGYHVNMFAPVKLFADKATAKIIIGDNTRIHGSAIHAYELVEVGKNCLIAANCQIMDCSGHDLSFEDVENRIQTKGTSSPVVIEDNVWLGTGCVVLPGVRIGRGSVIAANSVVTKSIPPMTLAGGNPAKVIRTFG